MKNIKAVHVLKVGDSISADGVETFHTGEDLQELVDTYDTSIHEAPAILGHKQDDKNWGELLSRDDSFPAYGWITNVYVQGNDLFVDLDASDELIEFIKNEKYKKRSLGYYGRNSKNNPVPGKLYIRHLAFLGQSPPAIKGLEDITLTESKQMATDVETKELLDKNAEEWLAFILKDDGNIVRETIVAFDPKPTIDNNYLYNSEEKKWEGAFVNDEEERYLFEIVEQENEEGGDSEFIVTVKADISENQAEEEEEVVEEDLEVAASANEPDTPAEEEAKANLEDQSKVEEDEEEGQINLTEDETMGKLLKEKTTTEKEYAPEEKENMEYRDDGHVDPDEAAAGMDTPRTSVDAVKDTELGEEMSYEEYAEATKAKGEEPMGKAEYMEMKLGKYTEEPVLGEGEMCQGEDCPSEEKVEATETVAEEEGEEIELGGNEYADPEKIKAMEEELNLLRAKVKAQEEEEMKAREEEMIKFTENVYETAKLLDSQYKKEDLQELLINLLHTKNEHMVYGEGDNQKTVLDAVKALVENLPEQVTLAEGTIAAPKRRNAVPYNPNYSKGSQDRREKILAIMDERSIPRSNMTEYVRINNELTAKEGHYDK